MFVLLLQFEVARTVQGDPHSSLRPRPRRYLIGRVDDGMLYPADIDGGHRSFSRYHAALQHGSDGSIHLYELGSRHGTSINGQRVTPSEFVPLIEGDVVRFAKSHLTYTVSGGGFEAAEAKPASTNNEDEAAAASAGAAVERADDETPQVPPAEEEEGALAAPAKQPAAMEQETSKSTESTTAVDSDPNSLGPGGGGPSKTSGAISRIKLPPLSLPPLENK